jgi:hypothetical protein
VAQTTTANHSRRRLIHGDQDAVYGRAHRLRQARLARRLRRSDENDLQRTGSETPPHVPPFDHPTYGAQGRQTTTQPNHWLTCGARPVPEASTIPWADQVSCPIITA